MPALVIRTAHAVDAPAACEILRRSISELCEADHGNDAQLVEGWLANKTPENVVAWIADPGTFVYVALVSNRMAGIAAITRSGAITLNYVSPDSRFKGVSKALLAQLERKANELGLAQCHLSSTKTAQQFYRMAGYREQPGIEASAGVPMVKDIA